MKKSTRKQINALDKLRLPELQARFAEVTGEETKAPNRRFLIRRITEALEARAAAEETAAAEPTADDATATTQAMPDDAGAAADQDARTTGDGDEVKLTKLSVEELRARYAEVIQRETSSTNRAYLIWKLREAQKGRIPIGPRRTRRADGEAADFKVLPLRMEADLVTRLDEARERLGLKSRMELLRRSLHAYLDSAGETEVAALFAPDLPAASRDAAQAGA